jgi:photosystem II stability/assembly factor-like uncharacterized protein
MKKILVFFFMLLSLHTSAQPVWQEVFSGISNNLKSIVFVNSSTGYVFGEEIYLKTTNAGTTWQQHPFPYYIVGSTFTNELTGYIAGKSRSEHDTNVVLKTTNGGLNWSKYYMQQTYTYGAKIKFVNQTTGYVYADRRVMRTTNAGISWIYFNVFGQNNRDFDAYESKVITTDFYTSSSTGRTLPIVHWSTNGGVDWHSYYPAIPINTNSYGMFARIIDNNKFYFLAGNLNYADRLYQTANGGNNWSQVNWSPNCTNIDFIDYDNLYKFLPSNDSSMISRSTNGGLNWQTVMVNTPYITAVKFINNLTGYAVADYGVILKTTNGGMPIGINTISTSIPDEFYLQQNYPNPFNPSTNIEFAIYQKEFVQLNIYNSAGMVIQELLQQNLQPGTYKYDFHGDNLPSGIYYYKLTAGNYSETKKMILLK